MAITLPLAWSAFAGKLRIVSASFTLTRYEETSGTARGELLVRRIAQEKWRAEIGLDRLPLEEAGEIEALVERLGSSGQFDLHNPRRPFPALDPAGALLGSATPVIHTVGADNRSLRLSGLPAGYVLSVGDMLAFGRGTNPERWSLHRIVERAVAASSGQTGLFEVEPHLRPGTAPGAAVELRRPVARMQLTGFDPGQWQRPHVHGMSFSAIEAY